MAERGGGGVSSDSHTVLRLQRVKQRNKTLLLSLHTRILTLWSALGITWRACCGGASPQSFWFRRSRSRVEPRICILTSEADSPGPGAILWEPHTYCILDLGTHLRTNQKENKGEQSRYLEMPCKAMYKVLHDIAVTSVFHCNLPPLPSPHPSTHTALHALFQTHKRLPQGLCSGPFFPKRYPFCTANSSSLYRSQHKQDLEGASLVPASYPP